MSKTQFKEVSYSLSKLADDIAMGEIGLPEIQRPFVWPNKKVRDLFDSMYQGYPVGYLLFWVNGADDAHRQIGVERKQKIPRLLVIDGQQRLTSLYAVLHGSSVLRGNFKEEYISIAFRPTDESFEVADAAILKDAEWIPNISVFWSKETDLFELVDKYMARLGLARDVSADEQKSIKQAFQRLASLDSYPFTALELSADLDEERVSDVFVRINSKGTPLNQADFILTLMSVFWDEGRRELEGFCRSSRVPSTGDPSPFNPFIEPDPDHLLRVSVALGFRRARLQHVYSILRGKDLETGAFSEERRERQFGVLRDAQQYVLDLQNWHEFFKILMMAGYRRSSMISSRNALLYTYAMYLIGKRDFAVPREDLRAVIARWFFMVALTGRYTDSPETRMEQDLADLRGLEGPEEFVQAIDKRIEAIFAEDYWSITLPAELATSSSRSPSLFAYYAALVLLDARVLYSRLKVAELLDPLTKAKKAALERHHLFPKAYLAKHGIKSTRETNQIANYALVEWADNIQISSQAPAEYVEAYEARFGEGDLRELYQWHALPDRWYELDYATFLEERRRLLARAIRAGFERLMDVAQQEDVETTPITELIRMGEGARLEFKSTLRVNLHTGSSDPKIEHAALKTVAAFLNSDGGTLVIGVADEGTVLGLENDGFPSEDKMMLHLVNLLKSRLGPEHIAKIAADYEDANGKRVLVIRCRRGFKPAYLKEGTRELFYVRTLAATTELTASQTQDYIRQRFGT
jgi:hypothetical protein